jgi:hypothetical protein
MDDQNHVQPMLDTVIEQLEQRHFRFAQYRDTPAVMFPYYSSTAIHTCIVDILPDRPFLRCFLHICCRAPEERRPAAAELITRINYGLRLGNFEMDFADGEIRYRAGIDVAGGELTAEMVDAVIGATVGTVDRYFPAIMSFLWSDMAPEDAVAMIEGAPAE